MKKYGKHAVKSSPADGPRTGVSSTAAASRGIRHAKREAVRTFLAVCLLLIHAVQAAAFCFEEAGIEYGISPAVLWGIAKHESNMNPVAVCRNRNGTFDFGLMQINSRWAKVLGSDRWLRLGDPCTNVKTGAWILSGCIRRHGYNWKAVGCYHSSTPARRERYAERIEAAIRNAPYWLFPSTRLAGSADAILSADLSGDPWHDVFGSAF